MLEVSASEISTGMCLRFHCNIVCIFAFWMFSIPEPRAFYNEEVQKIAPYFGLILPAHNKIAEIEIEWDFSLFRGWIIVNKTVHLHVKHVTVWTHAAVISSPVVIALNTGLHSWYERNWIKMDFFFFLPKASP